jgi:hypothetical protein
MDNEDRQDSLEALREKDNWVIWKTKDTKWTQELQRAGFHQLLSLNKTPERTAGAIKSRDGDGEETSSHEMQKNKGMLGEIPSKRTK